MFMYLGENLINEKPIECPNEQIVGYEDNDLIHERSIAHKRILFSNLTNKNIFN